MREENMKIKSLLALTTSIVLSAGFLISTAVPASATIAESYDFNTALDLQNNFDATLGAGSTSSNYSQTVSGGVANSGAINAPGSLSAVFASKNSYSKGATGSKYTFSSYLQSIGNSGYSGMGFSATPSTAAGYPYRPSDALGISVHGGGFVFHVKDTDYNGQWSSGGANIESVKTSGVSDLLNNGSLDDWYKVFFIVEIKSSTTFDIVVEVWSADGTTGQLRASSADAIFAMRNVSNSDISGANTLKSYINFSGNRVRYFDNFAVELAGNASLISAGAPVVLTNTSSLSGSQITFNGNVTAENGTVTERGFVYSTTATPTISDVNDVKITDGSGAGVFSETTASLAGGTYYVRAYATNSTGTSYGSEESISIVSAPTVTWAPTNTSAYVSESPLTPSSLATSNSSGSITYSIQNAGTTSCTVTSATGVISFTAAGDCVVRATVASASPYSSGTLDKTFTVHATSVPGAPANASATAGDAQATVTWSAPASNGGSPVTSYTVTASPGSATCSATAPTLTCTVTGLGNGTSYTFAVTATNLTGTSSASTSSTAVTPAAPVQSSPPSAPTPESPAPKPKSLPKVSGLQLESGSTSKSSKIKLQLSGVESNSQETDIQIKLFDVKGNLFKTISVPISGSTGAVEVSLPLELGEFTVEANTVSKTGIASDVTTNISPIVPKVFFTGGASNKVPTLFGERISGPISFKGNSFKLSKSAKNVLMLLSAKLKQSKSSLAITGFTAEVGASASFEKALAKSRAISVATYLQSKGLSNILYVSGYGSLKKSKTLVEARKVELRIIN